MLLTPNQTSELCHFASIADREARSDLAGGYIRNEDDYTSNFTGALRRIVNSNSHTYLKASSYLLPVPDERSSGCDATIIITGKNNSKITLFEAKLPGLGSGKNKWDYLQTSSGISHFSDQLKRQKNYLSQFAIFEMFYCDYAFGAQPSYMQNEFSSCVWHSDACAFDNSRHLPQDVWTKKDLVNMLSQGNYPIFEILKSICSCENGLPIQITGSGRAIAQDSRFAYLENH